MRYRLLSTALLSFMFNPILMAQDVYLPQNFPLKIPGWEIKKEADGSVFLKPKGQDTKQPPKNAQAQASSDTEVPNMLENFPDKIPGWQVIVEPDGSRVLIPQYTTPIPPIYDPYMPPSTAAVFEEMKKQPKTKVPTAPLADFPDQIPGWHIITEPDGSKLLFPQRMPAPGYDNTPPNENLAEQKLTPDYADRFGYEEFYSYQAPIGPGMLDEFPEEIYGWRIFVEPDGSRLLYPQHPMPYFDDYTHMAPPTQITPQEMQNKKNKPKLKSCFEIESMTGNIPADSIETEPCTTATPDAANIWRIDSY